MPPAHRCCGRRSPAGPASQVGARRPLLSTRRPAPAPGPASDAPARGRAVRPGPPPSRCRAARGRPPRDPGHRRCRLRRGRAGPARALPHRRDAPARCRPVCPPGARLGGMSPGSLVADRMGNVSAMLMAPGAVESPLPAADDLGLSADSDDVLERFRAEVARHQLAEWLPEQAQMLLDLSPSCPRLLDLMVSRGHNVIHAVPEPERLPGLPSATGRLHRLRADGRSLDWLASGSVDGVIAEGGCLSTAPAAELTLDDIHRVLRPDGRLLLSVDSLVAGLSRLADEGRWAELADVPAADVLLVPDGDTVIRCFWPEELHAMLTDAGFEVEWVRPRTVIADEAVSRALLADPGGLAALVTAELSLARLREGEAIGNRLVASARRR